MQGSAPPKAGDSGIAPASPRRGFWRLLLLALSGLVPLIGLGSTPPDPTFSIYSVFVLLYFLVYWRRRVVREPTFGANVRFALALIGAGWLLEILAWSGEYIICNPTPELLHPQLGPDLIYALAFYGSWSLAWLLVLRWCSFGLREVFIAQGLFGLLVEQQGAIFLLGLATFPLGMFWWFYVFLIYGSVAGIAYIIAGGDRLVHGPRTAWWKYLALLALVWAISLPVSFAWERITAGFIPAPAPICDHPFWSE